MKLNGLGTGENVIESLAWAVLAAQNEQGDLVRYQGQLSIVLYTGY